MKNAGDLRCEVAYLGGRWAQKLRGREISVQLLHPEGIPRAGMDQRNMVRVFSRQALLGRNLSLAHQVAGSLRNSPPS
jgi:hypothetical protein